MVFAKLTLNTQPVGWGKTNVERRFFFPLLRSSYKASGCDYMYSEVSASTKFKTSVVYC